MTRTKQQKVVWKSRQACNNIIYILKLTQASITIANFRGKKNWPLDGYDSLTESIQAAMVNGELRYLSNLHPALGTNKDYRATYNSQLIPTNQ
ncbi:MAG: hypothetical protein ACX93I_15010 [Winogradskyella sp.]